MAPDYSAAPSSVKTHYNITMRPQPEKDLGQYQNRIGILINVDWDSVRGYQILLVAG